MPDLDGEPDEFEVKIIKDMKLLPNLKKADYIAMCSEELMEEFSNAGITVL